MARYVERVIRPDPAGATRLERTGGSYREYHPDLLSGASNLCNPETMEYLVDVTARVARLNAAVRDSRTGYLYAALLRSEGIASSAIEGHEATSRAVALTELSGEGSRDTLAVARSLVSLREATRDVASRTIDHAAVHRLHSELLPELHAARPGYRRVQNWIRSEKKGGLLVAAYVPPPAPEVEEYMTDLLRYIEEGADTPLLKAAVVHAQFETVHPYEDGNGRVGRALVHTVLMRSGLVDGPVVPISAALRTRVGEYVEALDAYRYEGEDRTRGLSEFVDEFAYSTGAAVDAAELLHARATAVVEEWSARVSTHRSDSLVHRLAPHLLDHPAVTVESVTRHFGVSPLTARKAVASLVEAGVLAPARTKVSRSEAYVADDVLDLVTLTERTLASADFDTLVSAPLRRVPDLPERFARKVTCGLWMERARRPCSRYAGHLGQHR